MMWFFLQYNTDSEYINIGTIGIDCLLLVCILLNSQDHKIRKVWYFLTAL